MSRISYYDEEQGCGNWFYRLLFFFFLLAVTGLFIAHLTSCQVTRQVRYEQVDTVEQWQLDMK